MAKTPQEIYDTMKILKETTRDKKSEIKEAELADPKIAAAADEIEELKEQMKAVKKKEKAAKEQFKSSNDSLYDWLDSLKKQMEGEKERLVIAMIKNLKDDVQTEIWDEKNGQRKRVQVNFDPKMKKE